MTVDDDFDHWRDFDDRPPDDHSPGPARSVEITGRCTRCWGPIKGRKTEDDRWTRIECQLCRHSVDGKEADRDAKGMLLEMENNLKPVRVGHPPNYREGASFVLKILPDMVKGSQKQVAEREKAARAVEQRRLWLDRRDVPPGNAGYLYLQARAILSGIESLPDEMSAIALSDFDFGEPRITNVDALPTGELLRVSAEIPASHRKPSPRGVMARMGTAMLAGMAAAFACEVGMKAILMTRLDEAPKTHNLLELYQALPEDARGRLEADCRGISGLLKRHRHTFDRWRYLEQSAGEGGFGALVNTDRVWELGKAARVIVDECVTAGLTGEVAVDSTFDISGHHGKHSVSQRIHLQVTGGEAEIPWSDLLAHGGDDRH